VLGILCGVLAGACGRKGPPLPPIVYLPAAAGEFTAKRLDSDVVLQFKIPTANTDGTTPADLDRVEAYAHTGPLPVPTDFLKYGTLIGTLEVKAPNADGDGVEGAPGAGGAPGAPSPSSEGAAKPDTVGQGWAVTVLEKLTDAHMTPGPMPIERQAAAEPPAPQLETPGTVNLPPPVIRYYTVVAVSRSRNRRGAFATPVGVPLSTPPEAPEGVVASWTQDAITLAWTPVPGEVARTIAAAAPAAVETPPVAADTPVSIQNVAPPAPSVARFGYNVYDADAGGAKDPAEGRPPVVPLNSTLLTTAAFSDSRLEFGTERCYVVMKVEMAGTIALESAPTAPVCVTPADTFPPSAPRTLTSVTSENAVSLIWEPNTDPDLQGYLVLRGDAPDEKLTPLTPSPILDTTYRDSTVQAGRSYVYVVVAVDTATPPNVSEHSNRVTEVIR
jgi:hypothetical protein